MSNSLRYLIRNDLYRYEGDCKLKSFLRAYLCRPGFKFTVWLRICSVISRRKWAKNTIMPFLDLIYNHYRYKYGFDIPYNIEIGPGLLLYHFGGVVFNPSKCGKNATISQCTTVGMKIYGKEKKYPVLGDNVYMAPGSKAIGDIFVNNGTAIGTNAVLLSSTCENAVVVGIPGKTISNKGSKLYVNNPI